MKYLVSAIVALAITWFTVLYRSLDVFWVRRGFGFGGSFAEGVENGLPFGYSVRMNTSTYPYLSNPQFHWPSFLLDFVIWFIIVILIWFFVRNFNKKRA